ncbi:CASP-like protein 4D1 [Punica granatum]|uniref:CASP-like protein n=2 Tax=Punica granatum TaxID=22663 RepID=A0A218VRE1_PUNGR|nr:CASP-like protein 4D1 [Punica granatum]OWM62660.1 hypothetical protein CDL15_Pgr019954 [Punica granatum]PKI53491.1 hypothetical protein CRG98_026181 [Punica granatum]
MASAWATAISMLMLRVLATMFLAASMALMITNKYTDSNGTKTTFKDIIAYRYVLATAASGIAYGLLQLPFAVYYAYTEKRLLLKDYMPEFDFYGDKIISYFLASGVGAGFAVSFELKRYVDRFFFFRGLLQLAEEDKSKADKFLDRGSIATGLIAGGFLCMAVVSVLSSMNRTLRSRGFFK